MSILSLCRISIFILGISSCLNNTIDYEDNELILATEKLIQKRKAVLKGRKTRKVVEVKSESEGIIRTRIQRLSILEYHDLIEPNSPLKKIIELMQLYSSYNKIRVLNGVYDTRVLSTKDYQECVDRKELEAQGKDNSVLISGGFFIPTKNYLRKEDYDLIKTEGKPVGKIENRKDYIPIPHLWREVYGKLETEDKTLIHSAPLMNYKGKETTIDLTDIRFSYRDRYSGRENPLSQFAGSLTHCGDSNERTAISFVNKDAILHTLTCHQGLRRFGVNIGNWSKITELSTKSQDSKPEDTSTLNLDGGGSTYMAIRQGEKTKVIAKGDIGTPEDRPVSNLINVTPSQSSARERVSIEFNHKKRKKKLYNIIKKAFIFTKKIIT